MNRCCPQNDLQLVLPKVKQQSEKAADAAKPLTADTFLSASYFLAMLFALGAFPLILRIARESQSSETLLSAGSLGIAALVFTVLSFLYYSEVESGLKSLFAKLRMATLSALPLLFWWSFNNAALISGFSQGAPFEWAVAFGLCSSLLLWFIGFVIRLPQKQLLTCYLFLSAALCIYGGMMLHATIALPFSHLFLASGAATGVGFVLQTQSRLNKKCQYVESLVLLGVMLQCSTLLLFGLQNPI